MNFDPQSIRQVSYELCILSRSEDVSSRCFVELLNVIVITKTYSYESFEEELFNEVRDLRLLRISLVSAR